MAGGKTVSKGYVGDTGHSSCVEHSGGCGKAVKTWVHPQNFLNRVISYLLEGVWVASYPLGAKERRGARFLI
mgnify:FL=1|jgi:hypothetical protein